MMRLMETMVRDAAQASVMRGCGFGMLGIVTTMMGLANDLALALRTGGIGMLLMAFVLILKASRVHVVPFKRTEVWVMLDAASRPPEALAQRMIADARRAAMRYFAFRSAVIALILLTVELVVELAGKA